MNITLETVHVSLGIVSVLLRLRLNSNLGDLF